MAVNIGLSKSKYCKGIQCPKILWMDVHMPDQAVDISDKTVFKNGNLVGDLARRYFGKYSLVEDNRGALKAMCDQTAELMASGAENIAEASFIYDGLYCAVDILHKNGDGWDIVEVKSSTTVHDIYVHDMAFQYYVLVQSGINVTGVYNLHLDSAYVFHKELDIKKLFALENYTEQCTKLYDEVAINVKDFREYASVDPEPVKAISVSCDSPYECVYKQYCWKSVISPSIFDVHGLKKEKKFEYYDQGVKTFSDIVNSKMVSLNPRQMRQVETTARNLPDHIEKAEIQEFLDTLEYPIYHLDFETFQLPVPKWEGCSPYEQIPFQYSLHIEYKDRLEHKEFLAKEGTDPRRALAESLCNDIPKCVCSLAYNMMFEKMVLKQLAGQFPELADHLLDIRDHMHDLMIPFKQQHYYTKDMEGSYSIKYVLPALFPNDPELDYHNLDLVHNGAEASAAFADMEELTQEEIKELRANLLKYCGLDTYAMVKVLSKLREAVK